jgi:hypothetical protein
MAWTDSKPSSAELVGVGVDYVKDNMIFLQTLIEHFTTNIQGGTMASGWIDSNPTNIYLRGPVMATSVSPGASSMFREGDTYWNTTDKKLFGYDETGSSWMSISSPLGTPATSTDNAIVRWNGTTGATIQSSSASIDDTGNVYAPNYLAMAKGMVIDAVHNQVTAASIVGMWFFDQSTTATQLADKCAASGHTAASLTLRDNSLAAVACSAASPGTYGNARYLTINSGASCFDTPDTAAFSFCSGVTDKAFSVICLVKPTFSVGVITPIFAKRHDTTGIEWVLWCSPTPVLQGYLYDMNNSALFVSAGTTDPTGDNSGFHVYALTYDGSAVAANLKLYRDGVLVSLTYTKDVGYISMVNGGALPASYVTNAAGARTYGKCEYAFLMVIQQEITATKMKLISDVLLAYAGTEIS